MVIAKVVYIGTQEADAHAFDRNPPAFRPYTADTESLIDARIIGAMKPSGFLIF